MCCHWWWFASASSSAVGISLARTAHNVRCYAVVALARDSDNAAKRQQRHDVVVEQGQRAIAALSSYLVVYALCSWLVVAVAVVASRRQRRQRRHRRRSRSSASHTVLVSVSDACIRDIEHVDAPLSDSFGF